jgi:hypothetical protein
VAAVEVGHTDIDACAHFEEIGLVAAGDVVYDDVHLHLSESGHERPLAWLTALGPVAALRPISIAPGHKHASSTTRSSL